MQYGKFVTVTVREDSYRYFLPSNMNSKLIDIEGFSKISEEITLLLGRLDSIVRFLPDKELFIYMYVRKEAILSSQIEGTQSSLHDVFAHENKLALQDGSNEDIEEVSSYIKALNSGAEILKSGKFPFSIRLLKMIHRDLMQNSRGIKKEPGAIRTSQNWIGGSRPGNAIYVPPAPEHVMELLSDMEKFYHNSRISTPILCGMMHGQFETIHPFLDGNGRLGRLIIPMILCDRGMLEDPILYISYQLKLCRSEYYRCLQDLRVKGSWNEWIEFFLNSMKESVLDAYRNCSKINELLMKDSKRIKLLPRSDNIMRLYEYMKKMPLVYIPSASKKLNLSPHTIKKSLKILQDMEIVVETTNKLRDREYVYKAYYDILDN